MGGPGTVNWIKDALLNPANSYRFGLALSRETPNILSQRKIDVLFNQTFTPDEYRKVLIFGDIKYGFNITLTHLDPVTFTPVQVDTIGSRYPEGRYGYIRRYVKIKNYSSVTTDNSTHPEWNTLGDFAAASQVFTIRLDGQRLYLNNITPAHIIDPTQDEIWINLTGLQGYLNNSYLNPGLVGIPGHDSAAWAQNPSIPFDAYSRESAPPQNATLKSITFLDVLGGTPFRNPSGPYPRAEVYYHDMGNKNRLTRLQSLDPAPPNTFVNDSIRIKLRLWEPGDHSFMNKFGRLDIVITFQEKNLLDVGVTESDVRIPHTLLSGTLDYTYDTVTEPPLSPGILEVAIW
jgi:hypothetical protein